MRRKSSYRPCVEGLENRLLMAVLAAESEPNDTKGTADAAAFIATDNTVQLTGQIASKKDQDFFRLSSPASGTVKVQVANTNGLLSKIQIEDRSGREIFEHEARDKRNPTTFRINAGQDVFVRVRGDSHGLVGNYAITLTLTPAAPAPGNPGGGTPTPPPPTTPNPPVTSVLKEVESNDRKSTANLATLDSAGKLQIQGTAANDKDNDFFVLRPQQSGKLTVSLSSTGQAAKIEVEDRFGRKVAEIEQNNGQRTASFNVVAGETYFLRVRSAGKASSAYLVDLALVGLLNQT